MMKAILGALFAGLFSTLAAAQTLIPQTVPTGTSGHVVGYLDMENTWTAAQTLQGLTTTSPSWYAQITGDNTPRIRMGLNATDIPSISFGSGAGARDLFLERMGVATLRLGQADAAAPVAQTVGVQNVVAGTTNTAGANFTINGSRGTGTGAGGSIIFQTAPAGSTGSTQNALVAAATIDSTGTVTAGAFVPSSATVPTNGMYLSAANQLSFSTSSTVRMNISSGGTVSGIANLTTSNSSGFQLSGGAASSTAPTLIPNRAAATTGVGAQAAGNISLTAAGTEMMRITSTLITVPTIGSDATHTTSTVCQDTTSHALYSGSGTVGICLGTSSARFKGPFTPLARGALAAVSKLRPGNFFYRKGWGDGGRREQVGFLAEDVVKVIPKLVGLDSTGQPNSVDILGMVPILVRALQEQQAQINALTARLAALQRAR